MGEAIFSLKKIVRDFFVVVETSHYFPLSSGLILTQDSDKC